MNVRVRHVWVHVVRLALSVCCLATLQPARASQESDDEAFVVIKAGKIVTMAGDDIRDGVIVIVNGKVRAVGKGLDYPGNAKIIDARRHPLDSCFGTYKQLFASGQPFSYDLTELGEYYLQYLRLMDHWQQLLPDFVLDVQYEHVVADLETEVRRLLDFCGLPFEESCLRFHETDRAVRTASSEQVRRPIYASSVNLWRNYEHHLGELIDVLQPLLDRLPAADRPSTMLENQP